MDLGKHGSPGRVAAKEKLHSVVVAPTDLDKTALAITMITHAEKKGMSVLRNAASDDEFKKIISQRLKKPNQSLHGVATFDCEAVRELSSPDNTDQRETGDRLYYVLNTDMSGAPHHADIFATMPRPAEGKSPKAAWRTERERLLDILTAGLASPSDFRNGALVQQASAGS